MISKGKPFLRWAGSKRKQLSRLSVFWTKEHKRYIEPFCGSACLFFELAPQVAILGDNNEHLIELFSVVKNEPEQLYKRLRRIKRDLPTYIRWRKLKPDSLDKQTRALRFLYLNRNCFNGIYRTNSQGEFNVPMGKKVSEYFTLDDLLICSRLLNKTKLISGDFEGTISQVKSGDLVYMDPPYAVAEQRVFREYGNQSFSTFDIPRLSNALEAIDHAGADFVVSYADCAEAKKLAKSWNAIQFPIRRHIAGFAGARKMAYEWLISNRPIPSFN